MEKLARIAFNTLDWQRPSGDARKIENGTYSAIHGYGHEEWFFRSDWVIGDWRYSFLEGVNRSHAVLNKEKKAFDVTLFTIEKDKRRRLIANIRDIECLSEAQAEAALAEFKRRGWHDSMLKEIGLVGGDPNSLGNTEYAKFILNVRYRQENVMRYSSDEYILPENPIFKLHRYQLYDTSNIKPEIANIVRRTRLGSTSLPNVEPYIRIGSLRQIECSPEHLRMQKKLMQELRAEYPSGSIIREEAFVDVSVRSGQEMIFFEIKTDLQSTMAIRRALGQILEYAFYQERPEAHHLKLVIVGRCPLTGSDDEYLARLRKLFDLPVEYRTVSLE